MAKAGGPELLQVYLSGGALTELDALTERVNATLKAIFDAGGKVVEHHIDINGSGLVVRMVYTLPKGATLSTATGQPY